MKSLHKYCKFIFSFIFFTLTLSFVNLANADPSTRVARLGIIDGTVTFLPGGETDWVFAQLNRPLITGDRLWVDANAKTELQLGSAAVRLWADTDISIFNLDNEMAQFSLNQGSINLRIWNLKQNQTYEIDTPNLAFVANQVGDYRIDVNVENNTTTVHVGSGQATVYAENSSYLIEAQQAYIFSGTDLSNYEVVAVTEPDDFALWIATLDERRIKTTSHKYVSNEVIGYEDLDSYGTWKTESSYGNVWVPNDVPNDWAPYRDGSWAWIDPWGWTWIGDEPWGFAPFHYGRWAYIDTSWAWVPGPVDIAPIYAPALVAFFGGSGIQISISLGDSGGIGWFPLGPGDAYIPPYVVSQNYFTNINISNTIINNTYINNLYRHPHTRMNYRNWRVHNAMTVVPKPAFLRGEKVSKVARPVTKEMLDKGEVRHNPDITPIAESVAGGNYANIKPPKRDLSKPVLVKTTPPAPPPAFRTKLPKLSVNPGIPLDDRTLKTLKPSVSPAFQKIKVSPKAVVPSEFQKTRPTTVPPTRLQPPTRIPDHLRVPHPPSVNPNMPTQMRPVIQRPKHQIQQPGIVQPLRPMPIKRPQQQFEQERIIQPQQRPIQRPQQQYQQQRIIQPQQRPIQRPQQQYQQQRLIQPQQRPIQRQQQYYQQQRMIQPQQRPVQRPQQYYQQQRMIQPQQRPVQRPQQYYQQQRMMQPQQRPQQRMIQPQQRPAVKPAPRQPTNKQLEYERLRRQY
jgi:hypothetical protein